MAKLLSIKHDQITQQLATGTYDARYLWQYVKPYIKEITHSSQQVVLSFNDCIVEKR